MGKIKMSLYSPAIPILLGSTLYLLALFRKYFVALKQSSNPAGNMFSGASLYLKYVICYK